MPFGEWVLLDEDGSVVVLVVGASNGDDFRQSDCPIQFFCALTCKSVSAHFCELPSVVRSAPSVMSFLPLLVVVCHALALSLETRSLLVLVIGA